MTTDRDIKPIFHILTIVALLLICGVTPGATKSAAPKKPAATVNKPAAPASADFVTLRITMTDAAGRVLHGTATIQAANLTLDGRFLNVAATSDDILCSSFGFLLPIWPDGLFAGRTTGFDFVTGAQRPDNGSGIGQIYFPAAAEGLGSAAAVALNRQQP